MNSSELIIKNTINELPIGETKNFIWFICDIGIVALNKINENIPELIVLDEALGIALDLSKEEKEHHLIDGKRVILFYS
tara:strand:+ start:803 stop:1039 length:237 start_codon:yes stop_codon:yes gene_type:complete